MPNIILDRDVLPELVQSQMNAAMINDRLRDILPGGFKREMVLKELYKLRAMLSDKKPSQEVPRIIGHLLETYV